MVDSSSGNFCSSLIEFIDGARQFLESEMDRDSSTVQEMKLHLSEFIRHLIRNIPSKLLAGASEAVIIYSAC